GKLDEPAWKSAPIITDLTESYPHPGRKTTDQTEARVLYDDAALYVGVRLFDSPDSITAQLARRDASGIYSDWIHVFFDSYHDRQSGFSFSVNPKGVKRDRHFYSDVQNDIDWDGIWDVAVSEDSLGWTAEYRIPFSQLRFGHAGAGEERVWGFQLFRDIA